MTTTTVTEALDRFRTLAVTLVPGAEEALFVPDGEDLASVSFTVPDPQLWATAGDGSVLPAGRLERALQDLGWNVVGGIDGPVRDDVTTVAVHGPGNGSCAALVELWEAAQAVFRHLDATNGWGTTLTLTA